jgi:hypothetical protein
MLFFGASVFDGILKGGALVGGTFCDSGFEALVLGFEGGGFEVGAGRREVLPEKIILGYTMSNTILETGILRSLKTD